MTPRLATFLMSAAMLSTCPVIAFTAPHARIHVQTSLRNHVVPRDLTFSRNHEHHPRAHSSSSSTSQHLFGKSAATAAAAVATTTTAASVALPSMQAVSLACLLPSCLGYYKREYGVSYAYGGAVSITALMVYRSLASTTSLAACHAAALIFYGVRLSLFLLYREMFVPKMREFRDEIEEKAEGQSRLSRTPIILSCAFLYYCLCAPLFITAQVGTSVEVLSKPINILLKTLVGIVWGGFAMAALGDFQKTAVKQMNGDDNLVTGGIYKFLRHPNYTGETIAWTASALLGLVAAVLEDGILPKTMLAFYTICTVLGACGINFVLLAATKGLERKQAKKYGSSDKYQDWIKGSWAGFQLPTNKEKDKLVEPHLELNKEEQEERGSGI